MARLSRALLFAAAALVIGLHAQDAAGEPAQAIVTQLAPDAGPESAGDVDVPAAQEAQLAASTQALSNGTAVEASADVATADGMAGSTEPAVAESAVSSTPVEPAALNSEAPVAAAAGSVAELSAPAADSPPAEEPGEGVTNTAGAAVPAVGREEGGEAPQAPVAAPSVVPAHPNKRLDASATEQRRRASGFGYEAGRGGSSGAAAPRSSAPASDSAPNLRLRPEDDYYGLDSSPAEHVEPAAFQPSRLFAFPLAPGEVLEMYADVAPQEVGKAVRGSWFVTSGDELSLGVSITSPRGLSLYGEGPTDPDTGAPVSEGSFRFLALHPGTHTIRFSNPSASSARTVAFGWLLGKDDDDAFTARYLDGGADGDAEEDLTEGSEKNGAPAGPGDARSGPRAARGVQALVLEMLQRASRLHKGIDEIQALQLHADVRFARALNTAHLTAERMALWCAGEWAAIAAAAVLQAVIMRRFDYGGPAILLGKDKYATAGRGSGRGGTPARGPARVNPPPAAFGQGMHAGMGSRYAPSYPGSPVPPQPRFAGGASVV